MRRWENYRENRKKRVTTGTATHAGKLTNKVPLELLVQDWLNEQSASRELRAYLVESLLPSLVVGLEKLLTEVSHRGLVDDKGHNPDFNPINYLAQHLMRNNPKHSSLSEAHLYCQSMQEVSEVLKKLTFSSNDEQLTQLKSDIKKRRLERENAESAHIEELKRRERMMKDTLTKWVVPGSIGMPISEIHAAIQLWLELMATNTQVTALTECFSNLFSLGAESQPSEASLVTRLLEAGEGLAMNSFDSLADHLAVCGIEYKRKIHRDSRQALFTDVFKSCDPDKTGFVDRLRVLHLFNCFYDSSSSDVQGIMHNPRNWPIVEVAEAEEMEEDEERRSTSVAGSSLSEEDYQQFLIGDQEESPCHQGDDQEPKSTVRDASDSQVNISEDNSGADSQPTPTETQRNLAQSNESVQEETGVQMEQSKTEPQQDETATIESVNEKLEEQKKEPEQAETSEGTVAPRSHAGSVIERRLATASHYGRPASITAMRKLSGMASRPVSPSGPGCSWDHFLLNCSQFVQLVELFLGCLSPPDSLVNSLSSFIRESYTETAQERTERLEVAQQQTLILTRRKQVNKLFEMWDNDRSGYLELEELGLVLGRWKDFSSEQAIEHAKEILVSLGAQQSRLSRGNFQLYIEQLTENMKLREFEEFSEFLMTSVKLTFEEIQRGEKRKALLDRIATAGKASGLHISKGIEAAIAAIHEDNREFGGGKGCSVAVGLLEASSPVPCLHYKAASSLSGEVEGRVVGTKLLQSYKQGVSFTAVDTARPVCVQNIRKHGGVYFFIEEHNSQEYNGSLVVSPITTPREAVVGVVSVDTLREVVDDGLDTTFLTHEINFYQGIGVCLGEIFHWIEARQKLLTVSQSALSWVHRRCPQLTESAMYIVEPSCDSTSKCSYNLRCMLTTSGPNTQSPSSKLLVHEDNVFQDYLFQCVDNSEPVVANAYGQHHLGYPIRDSTGCAVAVLDLYMPPTQELRPGQVREVTKVLKLLTLAFYELSCVQERPTTTAGSSRPGTQGSVRLSNQDVSVLFDQLMLTDLKQSVSKLDNRVFAEMRSYVEPPPTIFGIVQSLLYILYPDEEFDSWTKCKQHITISVMKDLQEFDPLSQSQEGTQHKKLDQIRKIVTGVQMESVQEQGSVPAKYIYGWVNVCLSLLEHVANKPSVSGAGTQHTTPPSSSTATVNTPAE